MYRRFDHSQIIRSLALPSKAFRAIEIYNQLCAFEYEFTLRWELIHSEFYEK